MPNQLKLKPSDLVGVQPFTKDLGQGYVLEVGFKHDTSKKQLSPMEIKAFTRLAVYQKSKLTNNLKFSAKELADILELTMDESQLCLRSLASVVISIAKIPENTISSRREDLLVGSLVALSCEASPWNESSRVSVYVNPFLLEGNLFESF